ncbi:MAG: GNAT family N-acetyltransferase [Ignavibacteria bacterium]|nr:GNAT family N-acetyltransferase [Ignavibacteria bacterium]
MKAVNRAGIEVTAYCDELVEAHRIFSSAMWPRKRRRREEVYVRWKFRGPEKGSVDGLLLAVSGDKVIGQLGLIPVKVNFNGAEKRSQWACDLMVDPDHRREGVGRLLFENAFSRDMMTIGNNPSPGAEALMLKSGFRKISSGRLMVFPVKASHILKWVIPGRLQFLTPALSGALQFYFSYKASKLVSTGRIFRECTIEETAELMAVARKNGEESAVVHDMSFLEWRAGGFLNFAPEFLRICSDSGAFALHGCFGDTYIIYDWFCHSAQETREMVSEVIANAKKDDCGIIQAVANTHEEESNLSDLGFIRARNEENIIHYSSDGFLNDAKKFRFTLCDTDLNL